MPIIEHKNVTIPLEENALLWRYMSIDKFMSILNEKAIFFSRASKNSDIFEGSLPKAEVEERDRNGKRAEFEFEHLKMKSNTVLSCWIISNHESIGMWERYLDDKDGIVIQTNAERLFNAFEKSDIEIYYSKIRYIDYVKDIWYNEIEYPYDKYNFFTPFVHKKIEFKEENEFRLFFCAIKELRNVDFWEKQKSEDGLFVPIELNDLIEKIILKPKSLKTKMNNLDMVTFKELIASYGYDFKVENSTLDNEVNY